MKRLLPFLVVLWGFPAFAGDITYTTRNDSILSSGPFATISADGNSVKIDWERTSKCAEFPKLCPDPTVWVIARLMMAVRNQTWEPMR